MLQEVTDDDRAIAALRGGDQGRRLTLPIAFSVEGRAHVDNGPNARGFSAALVRAALAARGAKPIMKAPVSLVVTVYVPPGPERPEARFDTLAGAAINPPLDAVGPFVVEALSGILFERGSVASIKVERRWHPRREVHVCAGVPT